MNLQSVMVTALVVLLVSVALAVGSFFFVGPALQPDLARPIAPPSPAPPADMADRNLLALSLERIKTLPVRDFEARKVARNPFIWAEDERALLAEREKRTQPEEKKIDPKPAEPAIAEPEHTLKLVMIGETGKVALIDRRVFFEGDTIGTRRITTIEPLRVVLAGPDREEMILTMTEAPGMIAHHDPDRDRQRREPQRESLAIPAEGDRAGQLQYLMQELQMMQEGRLP